MQFVYVWQGLVTIVCTIKLNVLFKDYVITAEYLYFATDKYKHTFNKT